MSKMLLAVAVVACASCGVVGSSGSDDAGYAVASGGQTATGTGGGTGSYSEALTDPAEVEYVIKLVAQYKEDISARKVLLAFPGI